MSVIATKGFLAAGPPSNVALVINDGPEYTAAGVLSGPGVAWNRRVLRDGLLRAVVFSAGPPSNDLAQAYVTAEHTAHLLRRRGVTDLLFGASEVAVVSSGPLSPAPATVCTGEWTVGAMASLHGGAPVVVLTTDAAAHPDTLDAALREAAAATDFCTDPDAGAVVLLLASGASGVEPDPAALAGAVAEVFANLTPVPDARDIRASASRPPSPT